MVEDDLGADRGAPRDGTRRLRQNVRLQVVRKPEEREEGSPPAVEAGLGQRLRDGHPREVRRHEVQPRGRFHPGPRQAPQPPGALLWGLRHSLCCDRAEHFTVDVPPVLVQVHRAGLDAKPFELYVGAEGGFHLRVQ